MERVSDLLREVISEVLREVKDPALQRAQLVSILRVEATSDLSVANVQVSIMGGQQEREEAFAALQRAAGFIRREVNRQVRLRKVPELRFVLDDSMEHGAKIMALLNQVKAQESGEDSDDGTDGTAD